MTTIPPMIRARGDGTAKGHTGQQSEMGDLQTSVEFMRAYNAQVHEIVNAITAVVTGAEAGLNWLRADPPDLEEVQRTLSGIASDGRRAAEIVIRLRALMKNVPTADGAPGP